jgi:Ca2+-binding EF-hand superfamily protein
MSGSAHNLLTSSSNVQQQITSSSTPSVMEFPNGKEIIKFDEFINIIEDSCNESQLAENYLILAFSMFDRQK